MALTRFIIVAAALLITCAVAQAQQSFTEAFTTTAYQDSINTTAGLHDDLI